MPKPVTTHQANLPTATYRLQLNRRFTFTDAEHIVPYLHQLGISHVYGSPCLKARAGSLHGYDIVDHNTLNPEIGDAKSFAGLTEQLHNHGMGQILDLVPNHMAVGGADNTWWLDVLENGQASIYADYFDILWNPVKNELNSKVLLPFLGDHYGTVLENGELKLEYDSATGTFAARYYEHLFPIDPRTYPAILHHLTASQAQPSSLDARNRHQLDALSEQFASLPHRNDVAARSQRHEQLVQYKSQLATLVQNNPDLATALEQVLQQFNGSPGEADSFHLLHQLLEDQAYRLAYWQVASDEINYRRFFDINDLAGLRIEDEAVFSATHRLVLELLASGHINGLRIDHPDGLYNPGAYYALLQQTLRDIFRMTPADNTAPVYIVTEKILAGYEQLPSQWPLAGTTGYEVAALLNGLFVQSDAEKAFSNIYTRFIAQHSNFDEIVYERKKLVINTQLSSELTVLATLLDGIAEANRHTRDFTYHGLRDALSEIVACFPVYRTYVSPEGASEDDRRYVDWAIAQAKKHSTAADILIFDFIRGILLLEHPAAPDSNLYQQLLRFTMRFQQYTAPVMAKGMEDTALYIYNRLVSLNDVGFDPRSFGISANAFHHKNLQRLQTWPHAMVNTSTHDSKRGEDVRARINVLTEVAAQWRLHLGRWSRINRHKKRMTDDQRAPSRNDEYLLYQTLLGACPLETLDGSNLDTFRERIESYMLKAIKEAKMYTSWINPNQEYEDAMSHFVHALLDDPERNAFLADFLPFQQRIAQFGLYNSLSQTLLKLTVPGVPDIYQGNELWAFNLVDPDNRRPVDYDRRRQLLQALSDYCDTHDDLVPLARELLENINDGRAKLYITWKALNLRRQHPQLFSDGDYTGLSVTGNRQNNVCAFARHTSDNIAIVAASRWFSELCSDNNPLPVGKPVWTDTSIELPDTLPLAQDSTTYTNALTGEYIDSTVKEDKHVLDVAEVFSSFPLALLIRQNT
ncbi:MAG: malto-oligosyltrehalose synthase [Gammaproteobacteria bacterium]|jgi:(1->4)-alpha-D-glucan 1-alpha-D-glucosylmutase